MVCWQPEVSVTWWYKIMDKNKLNNDLLNIKLSIGIVELRYVVDRFHISYS